MIEIKEILVDELQDLLSAEKQIVGALPKMVDAASSPKLKEAFEKHLQQTEVHVQRLETCLKSIGSAAKSKPCKGMKGILEEGEDTIKDSADRDESTSDLTLIGAAQKVEHYEITSYGTARYLAKQIGELEVARLLTQTLGEEEASDHILNDLAKPILQEALSAQLGDGTKTPWGEPGDTTRPMEEKTHTVNPAKARSHRA